MTQSSVHRQASAIFLMWGNYFAIIKLAFSQHCPFILRTGERYKDGLPPPSSVWSEERLSFMTAAAAAVAM